MIDRADTPGVTVNIDAVNKAYFGKRGDLTAIKEVSLNVKPGEFVAVVGPSGCGKSTLLRMVAGLDTPTTGNISVGGNDVTGPDPRHGVVFQKPALFPWLDVIDNVTFGPRMRGRARDRKALRAEAESYIQAVGLEGFGRRKVYELSGGMMHRVALARVLINRPSLLLMDEPFGALDAQTRLIMQELLISIWQRDKATVLFVTHDVDEALLLADRTVVMTARPGQIKKVYDVPLGRPRDISCLTTAEFAAVKRQVLESIREETLRMMQLQHITDLEHGAIDGS